LANHHEIGAAQEPNVHIVQNQSKQIAPLIARL